MSLENHFETQKHKTNKLIDDLKKENKDLKTANELLKEDMKNFKIQYEDLKSRLLIQDNTSKINKLFFNEFKNYLNNSILITYTKINTLIGGISFFVIIYDLIVKNS